jgi:hypothetical protein
MVMIMLPDAGEMWHGRHLPTGEPALDQAAAGAESLQIAVATRQKSTARRLVSSCAVLEDTDQMVFTRGAAVTSRFANKGAIVV